MLQVCRALQLLGVEVKLQFLGVAKGVEEHLSCSLCIVPLLSCGCTAAFQRINCSLNWWWNFTDSFWMKMWNRAQFSSRIWCVLTGLFQKCLGLQLEFVLSVSTFKRHNNLLSLYYLECFLCLDGYIIIPALRQTSKSTAHRFSTVHRLFCFEFVSSTNSWYWLFFHMNYSSLCIVLKGDIQEIKWEVCHYMSKLFWLPALLVGHFHHSRWWTCLLYTSDAADER